LNEAVPAVYTAVYGNYDRLIKPVPQDIPVEWYCFTDRAPAAAQGWNVMVESPQDPDPRLSAKWPKMMPDAVLPEHKWTIWIDANLAIDSESFVREALTYAKSGIAVFRHPFRRSICHEAYSCLRRPDSRGMPVLDQVRHYYREGYEDQSLYACGVLIRDRDRWAASGAGRMWFGECIRWSTRDQLSFPVVLARLGLTPSVFPFHIGRAPTWLALARVLGLTPGTFPIHMAKDREARRLCPSTWFPSLRTIPFQWRAQDQSRVPVPRLKQNPWFEVAPHRSTHST